MATEAQVEANRAKQSQSAPTRTRAKSVIHPSFAGADDGRAPCGPAEWTIGMKTGTDP